MWNVSFCNKTHDYCVILSDGAFFQTVFASNNIQQHLQNCFAFELLVCLGAPCNLPCDSFVSFASAATSRALAGLTTGADMAQSEPRLQGSMNHSEIVKLFSTKHVPTPTKSCLFLSRNLNHKKATAFCSILLCLLLTTPAARCRLL